MIRIPKNKKNNVNRGAALIPVLVIMLALVFLVSSLSLFVVNKYTVLAIDADDAELDALTLGGLEAGVFKVVTTPPTKALVGNHRLRLANGEATVAWVAETARLNVNRAPRDWIATLIKAVASPADDPDMLADEIEKRRTALARASDGSAPPRGRSGPFAHPAELFALRGMTPDLYRRLVPLITTYQAGATIDPRLAPEALLASLPGMTEARLRTLLKLRDLNDVDGTKILDESGEARPLLSFDPSITVRFIVSASLKNGAVRTTEIVAALYPDDAEPYRVLYWSERQTLGVPVSKRGKSA
jgi:general secretion pathway protein K